MDKNFDIRALDANALHALRAEIDEELYDRRRGQVEAALNKFLRAAERLNDACEGCGWFSLLDFQGNEVAAYLSGLLAENFHSEFTDE